MVFCFFKSQKKAAGNLVEQQIAKIKVLVSFCDETAYLQGQKILTLVKAQSFVDATSSTESGSKYIAAFENNNFFDLWDSGLDLLKKYQSDVLLRVFALQNRIHIKFQNTRMYQSDKIPFFSVLNSLDLPLTYFQSEQMPAQISALIVNIIIALSGADNVMYRNTFTKNLKFLSQNKMPDNTPNAFLPNMLNFLALMYMTHKYETFRQRDATPVLNLLKSAFKNADLNDVIVQGNLYACLGQMYQCALADQNADAYLLIRRATQSYKKALKYFNRYVFVYDYGRLSLVLSNLYFKFYRLSDDNQALRDAIAHLREAEQIFTMSGHPFVWAVIQDRLGKYLSLIGAKSLNLEIGQMAVECLKNKQKVYTKEYAPDMWAQTEADIGEIYDHLGRGHFNIGLLEKALTCYESAIEVFQSLSQTTKVHELEITILRTTDVLARRYYDEV